MSTAKPTGGNLTPTPEPELFLLNPKAKPKDVLDHCNVLAERVKVLARFAGIYAVSDTESTITNEELASVIGAISSAGEELSVIIENFLEVEKRVAEAGLNVRPFNDRDRETFLNSIQVQSDKQPNVSVRLHQLEGMAMLADILPDVGISLPADIAQIVESEMGRVGHEE